MVQKSYLPVVTLQNSSLHSLMTILSCLKITLLLLKFQSSHMSSHGYGISKNSKIWLLLLLLLILNSILWWMLSSLVNNLSLLLLLPLTLWILLSPKILVIWIHMIQMLILCGEVLILLVPKPWKEKVKLVLLTLIISISRLYYILLKTWHLKKCKLMVVHYMPVMLLVLLQLKVKVVNLTQKTVNIGWNVTVKKTSLVQNVKMMPLLILKRNNISTNLLLKFQLFWTLMVLWTLVKLKMLWKC